MIAAEAASRNDPARARKTRAETPCGFPHRACPCCPMPAGDACLDGLIVWTAYKKARALMMFEVPPAARSSPTGNDHVAGIRSASRVASSWESPEQKTCVREMRITAARRPSNVGYASRAPKPRVSIAARMGQPSLAKNPCRDATDEPAISLRNHCKSL